MRYAPRAMVQGGRAPGESASLAWAVLLLHVCVLLSIVRSLEYLNVPVWEHVVRFLRAAR